MALETMTQQQRLKDLIKTNIVPTMKEAGFKKKGNWFSKRGSENTKFLNVMSSRWNTEDNVDFTLEMYVMLNDRRPVYDKEIAHKRIGPLKTGKDNWYNLTPNVDSEKLGQEIEQDISQYAIPFFERY